MSRRYVFPELFFADGAPVVVNGRKRLSLRWILHPSVGLPRALFHVWRFDETPKLKGTFIRTELLDREMLVSWREGPSAIVELIVSVSSGSVDLTAFSAAKGGGHVVDRRTVGSGSSQLVRLTGTPVTSITVTGSIENVSISTDGRVAPINDFVNNPKWKLVERVGLPATSPTFDGTGYPLDMQGPVGGEFDPVTASIKRVAGGTPDDGWLPITDRGVLAEPFEAPKASLLVEQELRPLIEAVAQLLTLVNEPSEQAAHEVNIVTTAPKSIHGIDASPSWEARARPSTIRPLESLLLVAGVDPFAALGLGFGTTLDLTDQQIAIAPLKSFGIYMITVQHKIVLKVKIAPIPEDLTFTLDGELATLYFGEEQFPPSMPVGITATPLTSHSRLDPPGEIDGRWLEVSEISWAVPVDIPTEKKVARTTGYGIGRGTPGASMESRTEKRLSGGWTSFVPASSIGSEKPTSVRFIEGGVPEALPGEPDTFVYSVAAHDWFGRWCNWVSADHLRASIAPQIPALHIVELSIEDTHSPTYNATATIEFTWDWSYRRPDKIHLRVLVHAEGTNPPDVPGSVLSVGGPIVGDVVFDFSSASKEVPPAGVEAIPEESPGNLRKYRVIVTGAQLDFATYSGIRATARARAQERIFPARISAWSRDVHVTAASPIPPPPPFVPSTMWWASLPDPRGFARTTLVWTGTAPMYAVYVADETALLRELDQPSTDLEISAADRLPALRSLDMVRARRAFRRVADRIQTNSLEVVLPRGSRLIHFYGVVPISSTGVEGSLPSSGNSYFAVATTVLKTPAVPRLIARDVGGVIVLSVEVPEIRVSAARIEIFRAPSRHRAVTIEDSGPPIASLDASVGVRFNGSVHWEITDPTPGPAWQSVFYRAVAYGVTERLRGEYGGCSLPTPAIEIVPSSALQPHLADLRVEDIATEPDFRLVSFVSTVTLARTPRGAHAFTVRIVGLDASVETRHEAADTLNLINNTLPTPIEKPNSIFRYDPVNPRVGRIYSWVPRDIIAVIVEATDPAGLTSSLEWRSHD